MPIPVYDYIIAGAGCAGLSLAMRIVENENLKSKSILIVDRSPKNVNDRTWCFWERKAGFFEELVYHQWQQLKFGDAKGDFVMDLMPFRYKLIKGIDFYNHCLATLRTAPNVTFLQEQVDSIFSDTETGIVAAGKKYTSHYVFNSIYRLPELKKRQYLLLQHFKGWYVKCETTAFNPKVATLMDFNVPQHNGTAFVYVLPTSEKEALIEFTVFSAEVLDDEAYDESLRNYILGTLKICKYEVVEREFGVIPMTNVPFASASKNIINIGTAGGNTKSSSGYTFQFIQKHSEAIIKKLENHKNPKVKPANSRFSFYDSVLIDVLHQRRLPGDLIFSNFFRKNKVQDVLQFLDNESNIVQEMKIITSLPVLPFLKAALHQSCR
jgi:lycopene beta-cyclase